jgi:thiamine kinase-like enzyme
MAPFVIGPDDALVMTARWPKCRCANVSLWNRFMQTLDYANRTVSRNRAQTTLRDDGSFEMVLAHRDPGHPNWIDTEGRPFGLVFWRYMLPEGEIQTPVAEVVKFVDVARR